MRRLCDVCATFVRPLRDVCAKFVQRPCDVYKDCLLQKAKDQFRGQYIVVGRKKTEAQSGHSGVAAWLVRLPEDEDAPQATAILPSS